LLSIRGANQFKKIFPKRWSSLDSHTRTLVNSRAVVERGGWVSRLRMGRKQASRLRARGGTNGSKAEGQEEQGQEEGSGKEEGLEEEVACVSRVRFGS
jgi:hypothetical protein